MLAALLPLIAPAWSGPVERVTSVLEDGSVAVSVLVEEPLSKVRATLSEAMSLAALDTGRTITAALPRGDCQELHVEAPGLLSPLRYVSLRCPTAAGYSEVLVRSEHFEVSEVQWTVEEAGEGTRITCRVRVDLDLPIAEGLLQSRIKANVAASMDRLVERL